MKKISRILVMLILCVFCLGAVGGPAAYAAEPSEQDQQVSEWSPDGKQFVINGQPATGLAEIDGKTYFFDKSGNLKRSAWCVQDANYYRTDQNGEVLKKQWITVSKKKYYLDQNGVRVSGLQKIGSKKYYFDKKGVMKAGTVKDGKTTYYMNDTGVLEVYTKKVTNKKTKKNTTTYYLASGKKMTKTQSEDYKTLLTARKIVAKVTKKSDSNAKKLKKCFNWVMKKPYITYRKFRPTSGWPAVYANDHFKKKGGDCHADGAAVAYLARAIGYKKVYVCNDSNGKKAQGHSWAEINGKVYDPLFAQAKSYKKYYGAKYKTYKLSPILHIKVSSYLK